MEPAPLPDDEQSASAGGRPDARVESTRSKPPAGIIGNVGKSANDEGNNDDGKDAEIALEILRDLVAQEVVRAERAASRARQAFVLAAGFFALTQTAAFGSFAAQLVVERERRMMLVLAALAALLLAICGAILVVAESAFKARNLDGDQVVDVLNASGNIGEPAAYRFVELYSGVVEQLRIANVSRSSFVLWTQVTALASAGLVVIELIYSLHARLS